MKVLFKDSNKIIINSLDSTEVLVCAQFLKDAATTGKSLKVEERKDINDDTDGLVISIIDTPSQQG